VAHTHSVWQPDRQRKVRRKYGCLVKTEASTINDMLLQQKGSIFDHMAELTAEWKRAVASANGETAATNGGAADLPADTMATESNYAADSSSAGGEVVEDVMDVVFTGPPAVGVEVKVEVQAPTPKDSSVVPTNGQGDGALPSGSPARSPRPLVWGEFSSQGVSDDDGR
jgi:hypothetical protein